MFISLICGSKEIPLPATLFFDANDIVGKDIIESVVG